MKKAARALLRAAFVNDCRLPGSAAGYTMDEQRKGFVLGQRKKRRLPPRGARRPRTARADVIIASNGAKLKFNICSFWYSPHLTPWVLIRIFGGSNFTNWAHYQNMGTQDEYRRNAADAQKEADRARNAITARK
jgi:hypothetical protein